MIKKDDMGMFSEDTSQRDRVVGLCDLYWGLTSAVNSEFEALSSLNPKVCNWLGIKIRTRTAQIMI